jgi:membrane-associated protease RseP (regulator of RpoE activity)
MAETNIFSENSNIKKQGIINKSSLLNLVLFVSTFITTSMAGTVWAGKDVTDVMNWHYGLTYSFLIMGFLLAHEMGHYIASRLHKIDASLPYYIPIPFKEILLFGTLGALIKTKAPIQSRRALFDIGAAGPIAGFIVCIIYLIIGFLTLPQKDFIYNVHPQYLMMNGMIPETGLHFGDTIVFSFLANIFANPSGWLPPMNEIYHLPFLCVGWFGLFVTTLNMLPIGQLDGGHIVYAMFGKLQKKISIVVWYAIFVLGISSLLNLLLDYLTEFDYPYNFYIALQNTLVPVLSWMKYNIPYLFDSWGGWFFWALMTRFIIKIKHPEILSNDELDTKRKIIGWITMIILLLSFSFKGLFFV